MKVSSNIKCSNFIRLKLALNPKNTPRGFHVGNL